MAVKPIFTEKRRDLLAKTIMDIVKIVIAAGFANEFFLKFGVWVTYLLAGITLVLLFAGIFICSKGGE